MEVMAKAPERLSEKLSQLARNHSQKELAEAFGVSRQQVANYLSGASTPSPGVLLDIARFFNVPLEYLLDDEMTEPTTYARMVKGDVDIVAEFRRRYVERAEPIKGLIESMERLDWEGIGDRIGALDEGIALPADISSAVQGLQAISRAIYLNLLIFDMALSFDNAWKAYPPPQQIQPSSLEVPQLMARIERMLEHVTQHARGRRHVNMSAFSVDQSLLEDVNDTVKVSRPLSGKLAITEASEAVGRATK